MAFLGGFVGFIIGVVVGAIAGVVCYWYFVSHRNKISVPTGISDIKK